VEKQEICTSTPKGITVWEDKGMDIKILTIIMLAAHKQNSSNCTSCEMLKNDSVSYIKYYEIKN
jgi:hypothetical protein